MGHIIQAAELEIGDLYREYLSSNRYGPGRTYVRKVTGSRTVRTSETYQVLTTMDVEGKGLHGEISLRADMSIEKLEEIYLAEVNEVLTGLSPGEQLNIVYAEGRFWT